MERKKRKGLKWLNLLWILPLAIVLAVAVLMYVVPAFETAKSAEAPDSADWMALLPDEKYLSEVVLPGTHDSATQYVDLAFFSKCQALDIGGQLDAGYRYLDIRLGDEDGELMLMHGFTHCRKGGAPWSDKLTVRDVLSDCYAFLDEHPTETIVFAVKHEHGEASDAAFLAMLRTRLLDDADRWLMTDVIPTVGEARGKLVLMCRAENSDGELWSGIPMLWKDQGGYEDVSKNAEAEDNGAYTLWVQDRYEYGAEDKWRAFTDGMDKAQPDASSVALNFLSTKGTAKYGHPYSFAGDLNGRLNELEPEKLRGWVIVDFGTEQLAEHIRNANFR